MTLLSGLLARSNPLENPGRPLTDASLLSVLGGLPSATGKYVTPESSLRVGAAFRSMQIIASAVAGMPLKVYRHADHSEVRTSVLTRDRFTTKFRRWQTFVAHMVGWGNGFMWKVRNPAGTVTNLIPVHPARVTVEVESAEEIGLPFAFRFTIDGRYIATSYEILHVPLLSLDGITGLGPISYVREMFGVALSAEEAAARLYGQGMMLSGVLETDQSLNSTQADTLKAQWRAKLAGVSNAHEVAILDRGAKFHALSMPPDDAQFLESRKFQVTEIARLLGVPGWMLNDQEKSTSWGAGMEQQFITFVMLTLQPYMQAIEQQVTLELLPESQYAEWSAKGLLRGDSKARAAYYASGIVNGWLVPNDIRPMENLPPVPWGDHPYHPHTTSATDQTDTTPDGTGDGTGNDGSSDGNSN